MKPRCSISRGDRGDRDRGLLQQLLAEPRGHDDLLERPFLWRASLRSLSRSIVRSQQRRCQRGADRRSQRTLGCATSRQDNRGCAPRNQPIVVHLVFPPHACMSRDFETRSDAPVMLALISADLNGCDGVGLNCHRSAPPPKANSRPPAVAAAQRTVSVRRGNRCIGAIRSFSGSYHPVFQPQWHR